MIDMKIDINQWIFEIPLDDIQKKDYTEDGDNPCICCGKQIENPDYYVHLLNTGMLVSSDADFQESQGLYPIGTTCKNKLPNNFYFKPF
jgi:hypothetical protein